MVGIRARELRREDGDALCHTSSSSSFLRRLITVYVKERRRRRKVLRRERESRIPHISVQSEAASLSTTVLASLEKLF